MFRIVRATRDSSQLQELVGLLDADLHARMGTIQSQYDQFNALASIDGAVLVLDSDQAVGCGCYRRYSDDTVEIKRMFVRPVCRGSGAAQLILAELEKWATEVGYSQAILETGLKLPEAIRFYEKSGYARTENYGQYIGMETSVCMAKSLAVP